MPSELIVFFFSEQFYIQANSLDHCGHAQFRPDQLAVSTRELTKGERQLVHDCGETRLTPSASAALINRRNALGVTYDPQQMENLMRQRGQTLNDMLNDATSAEKLVASLQNMTNVAFLTVSYDPTEGLLLSMSKGDVNGVKSEVYKNPSLYGLGQLCTGRPEY